MINFLLTNWWIYVPVIAILLFLTAVTNQKINQAARTKQLHKMSPEERQRALQNDLKRQPGKFERFTSKHGLRGVFSHIFPKR